MPARTNWRTISGDDVAGPNVQTILARRFMFLLVLSSVTHADCALWEE